MEYMPPKFAANAFNCPNCGVLSHQSWSQYLHVGYTKTKPNGLPSQEIYDLPAYRIAKCDHCSNVSIWLDKEMIFPLSGSVALPNPDLSDEILKIYSEAKNIVNLSPRGAAALLRLAIQMLCKEIGEPGKNINSDIASLVKKGLPEKIQKALDAVRVIGNNAVHPGQMDLDDTPDIAYTLFKLVNVICNHFISEDKEIDDIFKNLPDSALKGIEMRDNKS